MNAHLSASGLAPVERPFNDSDIVVPSFCAIPLAVGARFLCIHAHPNANDGKILLQVADSRTRLRIDIFQAVGGTLSRSTSARLGSRIERIVSVEDLAVRATRHVLRLELGNSVPEKIARDLLHMVPCIDYVRAERAWAEHRGARCDNTFQAAIARAQTLIVSKRHLLAAEVYSTDTTSTCARCRDVVGFKIAPKRDVMTILGYC